MRMCLMTAPAAADAECVTGKSTLINALLNDTIVPTSGMKACTATVIKLSYNHGSTGYEGIVTFISRATSAVQISCATSAVPRQQCHVTVPRQQCHVTVPDQQCHIRSARSAVPRPQCQISSATSAVPGHIATSDIVPLPAPLMDTGAEVVDLHAFIAKIDREFKTQRYDDIDAPLLYIRIQIGEATCSALIDCGASRNYISQDFMGCAGLGTRVRRKSQPTQVTLADGHTHKSIDRCIDAVPVYFAPHASEAVSFDILDTKFDMILGMSWLRSKDHPVNFFNRTIHIRDRNGVLVPCT
ncbi:hypothetical protein CBR_g40506 [Chara braunii]|uniref:Reverse transcriptase domain-containing protein n=1 Tax=Chara braunii TaxID=69332 RepID=A0A388K1X9_CHABU|nr:hypothetical protein CBR_g40506 [Chara braunii]|eukprot:GBG64060.1 hypothetical protein CBR_g40506 [Chara braunii]